MGFKDGELLGRPVGAGELLKDGAIVLPYDGEFVGEALGMAERRTVGIEVVFTVGVTEGLFEGREVGKRDGNMDNGPVVGM